MQAASNEETEVKTLFPTLLATSNTMLDSNEETELKTLVPTRYAVSKTRSKSNEETELKTLVPTTHAVSKTMLDSNGETELKTLVPTTQAVSKTTLNSNEKTELKTHFPTTPAAPGAGRPGESFLGGNIRDAEQWDTISSNYAKDSECTLSSSDDILTDSPRPSRKPTLGNATFINPETLGHESNKISEGPRANSLHVFPRSDYYDDKDTDTLIELLRKHGEPRQNVHDVRQCILTRVIPRLERSRSITELSRFLISNDVIVCRRVQESLMNFFLTCEEDQDVKMILKVEENIWTKLRPKQDHVFDLGLLELLVWGYLLCHINVPNKFETKIKETSESRKKDIQEFVKETQSTASSDVFKAMLSFLEDFPKMFAKRGSLPLSSDVLNTCERRGDAVNKLIKGARFCNKFTHLYSLLKQIVASEHDCENILAYLSHIFQSLIGTGSCGKTQTLAMLLIKGCTYLLQNVFKEAEVQIGPDKDHTQKHLSSLIERCVVNLTKKNCPSSWLRLAKYKLTQEERLQYIISEISPLIFHRCRSVRDPIHALISKFKKDPMLKVFIEEIMRRQANCGLKISSKAEETDSFFQTLNGSFGTTKVIIHAHTPCYEKLHNLHAEQQVSPEKGPERDRHINNLDMLRKLPRHPNIVELYAYQVKPYPWYYIVEDCQQTTLLRLVLQRRNSHSWISDTKFCNFLIDIVLGLAALHEQNIVLRDLTLHNFFLVGDRVKIGDLSRACVYKTESGIPVKDLHPGDIPTRWTSPEALLEGSFTPSSDVWALGLVIYALFTHGCDPFTEYYVTKTEDVMRMVVFEELLPFHWSCIPDDLYSVLKQCMRKDPHSRIEVPTLHDLLVRCRSAKIANESYGGKKRQTTTFDEIHARDMFYPIIDDKQKQRHHLPERGLPLFIHKFRKDRSENFKNSSKREWYNNTSVVTDHELHAQSDVIITQTWDRVTVKEPMSQLFVTKRLPYIEAANIDSLKATSSSLENNGSNHYIQVRTYGPGDTLLNTTLTRSLDSQEIYEMPSTLTLYLRLCLQVAEITRDLHKKDLIHRDLRAKNFLVDQRTQKVYACRTGRIFQVPESGIVQDMIFTESSRWLPPEALFDGIYSKAGDVYMLAMLIYEVIQAYEQNNIKHDIFCVPYSMAFQKKLAVIKQTGEFLERPDSCPVWLYDFLVRCWNPDRCDRPDVDLVVCFLRTRLLEGRSDQRERLFTLSSPSQTREPPKMRTKKMGANIRRGMKLFGRLGKTIKKKFTKRLPEPSVYTTRPDIWGTVRSERTYASVNESFLMEEPGEESVRPDGAETVLSHGRSFLHCDERLSPRFSRSDSEMENRNDSVQLRANPGRQKGRRKRKIFELRNDYSSSSERYREERRNNRKRKQRGRLPYQSMWVWGGVNGNNIQSPILSETTHEHLQPSLTVTGRRLCSEKRPISELRTDPMFVHSQSHVSQIDNRNVRNRISGRSVKFVTQSGRSMSETSQDSDTMLTGEGQRIVNNKNCVVSSKVGAQGDCVSNKRTGRPFSETSKSSETMLTSGGQLHGNNNKLVVNSENSASSMSSTARHTLPETFTTNSSVHQTLIHTGKGLSLDECGASDNMPNGYDIHRMDGVPTRQPTLALGAGTTNSSRAITRTLHVDRQEIHSNKLRHDANEKPVFDMKKQEKIRKRSGEGTTHGDRHEHFGDPPDVHTNFQRARRLTRSASEGSDTLLNCTRQLSGGRMSHDRRNDFVLHPRESASGFTSTERQMEEKIHIHKQGRIRNGTVRRSLSTGAEKHLSTETLTNDEDALSSGQPLGSQLIAEYRSGTVGCSDSVRLKPGRATLETCELTHLNPSVNGTKNQSHEDNLNDKKELNLLKSGNESNRLMAVSDQIVRRNNNQTMGENHNRTSGIRSSIVNEISDNESSD